MFAQASAAVDDNKECRDLVLDLLLAALASCCARLPNLAFAVLLETLD